VLVEAEEKGPGGVVRKIRRTEYRTETRTHKLKIDPKKALLSTAGGKDVAPEDLKRLLAKPAVIVLANGSDPVDKFYLQLYAEGTLVVVPPASESIGPRPGQPGGRDRG